MSREKVCGQAPSDYPGFAELIVEQGIDPISLNPDSVIGVKKRVAALETSLRACAAVDDDKIC